MSSFSTTVGLFARWGNHLEKADVESTVTLIRIV